MLSFPYYQNRFTFYKIDNFLIVQNFNEYHYIVGIKSRFPLSVPMYACILKPTQRILMRFFKRQRESRGRFICVIQV